MNHRVKVLFIGQFAVCLLFSVQSSASATSFDYANAESISLEYLLPSDEDRDIRTHNLEVRYLLSESSMEGLTLFWGVLATYARGEITQLEGSIAQGNLREVTYKTSAFGIGPGVSASYHLLRNDRIALLINASGNVIIYNKRFPVGGDYYNFMWRGGLAVKYYFDNSLALEVGYHLAHISNGQGAGPGNPGYDAEGVIIRFSGVF